MSVNTTSVDSNNLVEECFGISSAIQTCLKDAEDVKAILEDKKTYLKYIRSKVWIAYKTGEKTITGLEGKPTDKAVDMAVDCDSEVQEATIELNTATHNYNIQNDYATAMDAKKKSLEIITRYALGGWFSDLKIASISSIQKFADGMTKEGNGAVDEREALREKRRSRSRTVTE